MLSHHWVPCALKERQPHVGERWGWRRRRRRNVPGRRTPALHRRWRWTVAGLSSWVSCVIVNDTHRQCARPRVGAGGQPESVGPVGDLGGARKSRTGHLSDGAESEAPSSFRCCPRGRDTWRLDLVASPASSSNAKITISWPQNFCKTTCQQVAGGHHLTLGGNQPPVFRVDGAKLARG